MADSLLLSFSSNGSSRPPSRAHSHASDATERPDTASSTRALTKEVDHIKHLIKRSQNVSAQPPSITAQLFRQRSVSTPITVEFICHELDVLKRRIREEQQQLQSQSQHLPSIQAQSALEVDPDASESEVEIEDILDEREEDLERAREEIRIVKQNEEQLLEAAESRVDRLLSENERLEATLSGYKDQLEALQKSLQDHQSQLTQLRKDNKDKTSSCDEAQKQIAGLQNLKAQADASLKLSSARVSQSEEESRKATEGVKRLVLQHDTRQKELSQEIHALNGKNNELSAEVEELRASSRTLREKLDKAEAQSARSKKEHDARCNTLLEQVEEHKRLLQDSSRDTGQHIKDLKSLRDDRDAKQSYAGRLEKQLEEYDEKLTKASHEHEQIAETHRKQVEDMKREHGQALRGQQARGDTELKQLQQTLDDARSAHAAELDDIKAGKVKEVDAVKAQWRLSLQKLEATRQSEGESASTKLTDEMLRLKTIHNAELENAKRANGDQVEALKAQLTALEAQVTASKESHKAELDTLRSKHEASLKAAADEMDGVKQMMRKTESSANTKIKELQELLTMQTENAEASLVKVAKSEEAHRLRVAELKADLKQAKARLGTSSSTAGNLEENLKSQVAELETQLSSKGTELISLKADLRTAQETKDDQVKGLAADVTALSKEVASKEASIKQLTTKHSNALRESKAAAEQAVQEAQGTAATQLQTLREEHRKALQQLVSEHEDVLSQTKLEAANRQTKLEKDLANQREATTAREKQLATEQAKALGDADSKNQLKVNELTSLHATELRSAQLEAQQRIDEMKAGHDAHSLALADEHNKSTAELQSQHRRDVEDLRQTQAASQKLRETELSRNKEQQEEFAQKLREQHNSAVTEIKSEHARQLEVVQEKHGDRVRQLDTDRQSLEQSLKHERLQTQHRHEAEIRRLEQSLQEQRDEANAELQRVNGELTKAQEVNLSEVQSAHQTEINTLTAKLADLQEKLDAEASSRTEQGQLGTPHQGHIAELEAGWSRTLHESAAAHKADSQRAVDEASCKADAANRHFQEQIAEHESAAEARITSLQEAHTRELAQSKADLALQVESAHNEVESAKVELAKARETHGAAVEKLRADHLGQAEGLRAQHNEPYARLQSQHEDNIQAMRKDLEATHNESVLVQLRREHSSELQQMRADHETALDNIKSEYRSEAAGLRKEVEEGLSRSNELKAQHVRQLEDITSAHASELGAVRALLDQQQSEHVTRAADAERQLAALRVEHTTEFSSHSQADEKALAELCDAHSAAEASSQQEHPTALSTLKEEHSKVIENANVAHQVELDGLNTKHDAAVAELQAKHEQVLGELRAVDQTKINEHVKELQRVREAAAHEIQQLRHEHQQTLQSLKQADEKKDAEHAAIKQDHEKALLGLKHQLEKELEGATSRHRTDVENLRLVHETQLDEVRSKHEQSLAEQNALWRSEMDALQEQHGRSIHELARSNEAKLRELQADHEAALLKAVTGANVEATGKARLAEQQHRAALESAVDRARRSGQVEVKNLKKRHQDAVAQVRKMAQQQTAAQLTDLETNHQQEHQAGLLQARLAAERELQATIESHQSEVLRLDTEHQTTLDALKTRLELQRVAEMTTKEDSHQREVEAIQTRLDATMTGQAEAERSVARLRQQVSQAEQRAAEDKLSSDEEIAALKQEKTDLTTQLHQVQNSLRDLQGKISNGTTALKTRHAHEELASVKSQLSTLEEDRATLRLALQKRLAEKNDLIRQNDFLVQELETLHAQRLRPQYTARQTRDALVQTEDFVSEEPKVDLTSFQDIKTSRCKSARPVTPMSPGQRQARDEIDMAWKTRSFEDYLHTAKTELSELGSVITANETLFAQKIQEHVGELQRVKDELAADYKSRLDDLATDKQKMEQMVTSKQTAAFAKDRQQLVASYGADRDDSSEQVAVLTSLPVSDAIALRTAEERLVQDYNKRIAKRKSQIALRHAEEYHALTEEYDKKMARLLDNQYKLEGDLSVDPWKFERDLGDLRSKTVQLESGKERSATKSPVASRSQRGRAIEQGGPTQKHAAHGSFGNIATGRPKTARESRPQFERWTSHPRTSTSIPRSSSVPRGSCQGRRESPEPPAVPKVLFPGGRDSRHSTSQPYQGRGKYPPVAERSLLRTKNPPDVQEQRRVFTAPSPSQTPTKRDSAKAAQPLDITPTEVERQSAQPKRRTQSIESPTRPGFLRRVKDHMSRDGPRPHFHRPGSRSRRPGSKNGLATTAEPEVSSTTRVQAPDPAVPTGPSHTSHKSRRSKSTKLSSGMIYYQAPKQSPTTEYD